MRRGFVATIAGALLYVLYLSSRQHLRVLRECVRTYATFGSLPLNIHRYSPPLFDSLSNETVPHRVPKILHQICLTPDSAVSVPERYADFYASCLRKHEDWQHVLWTNDKALYFMTERHPDLVPMWQGYGQTIQRTNILRYLVLEEFGGVYLDLDIECLHPLDELLDIPFLSPAAYPSGINNAFLLTRPHHPFLTSLIERIPRSDLRWGLPYVENMLSTGCMFISNAYVAYMSAVMPAEDRLWILGDEQGRLEPHMLRGAVKTDLFRHDGASSWHGWDAAGIVTIGKYWKAVALLGLPSLVCLSWLACVLIMRRKSTGRTRASSKRRMSDEERMLKDG